MKVLLLASLLIGLSSTGYADDCRVVHGWPQVPDNTMLDEVSGVAAAGDEVFVLTRAGRKWPDDDKFDLTPIAKPTVFVFSASTGKQVAAWGANTMAMPHQLTIDGAGNVWVADVALHQVLKFSHEGKLLLTLGERAVAGDDAQHFNKPSDVGIAADGTIYVSDGYGNSRIVKFAPDGKYVAQWGTKGSGPGQLSLPHGIALDREGRVYVLDRDNKRVQVFSGDGKFVAEWKGERGHEFASPQDVIVGADGTVYVSDGGSEHPPDHQDHSGFWIVRADGSVASHCGRYGNYDGQVVDPHAIAVDARGAVYVADFEGKRVQKFELKK